MVTNSPFLRSNNKKVQGGIAFSNASGSKKNQATDPFYKQALLKHCSNNQQQQ
jgi:hypothetical protein